MMVRAKTKEMMMILKYAKIIMLRIMMIKLAMKAMIITIMIMIKIRNVN